MKTLGAQLAQYASYHRDRRNIATHFVGIPLIVLALASALSRPALPISIIALTPALIGALAAAFYYLRLDLRLGAVMVGLEALALLFGHWAAGLATADWGLLSGGLFVVGWLFQLVGHVWEGRKPAFVDDIVGLIIGPLFLAFEALAACGLFAALKQQVEAQAGRLRQRD
jgi:uncharacterized membrane protein YGL010W